jgi:hypothetical protein
VEISVPYLGSETVLLVHIEDLARMLVALGEAARPAHAIYTAPREPMTVAELKHEIESLNANMTVRLGTKPLSGGVWLPHPAEGRTIAASRWKVGLLEVLAQFREAAHDEQRLACRS